uniref:Amine oxidase domain-containing protein n=1 Tax=Hemiselmis andersenii TaxID=464988 RepID=A0A6U4NN18_HEMAN|mmetsp:Transcript_47048/g.113016  ORF Transcript_47048/g.113016 Transcript_47048/m.113016 type:complete len:322 (-) Transcript_47048:202-1167(-)
MWDTASGLGTAFILLCVLTGPSDAFSAPSVAPKYRDLGRWLFPLSPSGGAPPGARGVMGPAFQLRGSVSRGTGVWMQAEGGTGAKRVVIVGGGIGGLCVAGRLAKARPDWRITILEKNEKAGGRLDTVEVGDGAYRFDTGPTLLLAPDIYRQTFEAMGSRLEDHVELVRVDPSYRVFSPDATNFTASTCLLDMKNQLEEIEEGGFRGFLRYMEEACVNYVRGFNSRPFLSKDNSLLDYANIDNLLLLRDFDPANLVQTHSERLSRFFKTEKLRAIMSFQNLYVGPGRRTPTRAPALLAWELLRGCGVRLPASPRPPCTRPP